MQFCAGCRPFTLMERRNERWAGNPALALNNRMANAVKEALNGRKAGRSWEALVGYTLEQIVRHLERQFVQGMGWHNRAEWHVDHIRPLASFSFTDAEHPDFRAAWALSNLRPLWAAENRQKQAQRLFLL